MVNNFIFIEDGSLDAENLNKLMKNSENSKVKFITYKQGAAKPELVSIAQSEAAQQNPEVYKKEAKEEMLNHLREFLKIRTETTVYEEYSYVQMKDITTYKTSYRGTMDDFIGEFEHFLNSRG